MTSKQQYRQRAGEIRQLVRSSRVHDTEHFAKVLLNGTFYIYNKTTSNIILKWRTGEGVIGVQYRATSHYRPLLETITPPALMGTKIRRVASPNMRKHVRDVRALIS